MMLGNLTLEEIERRLGFCFPEDTREFMLANHQSTAANIEKGRWHCFDIPFNMLCGDMETAKKIYNSIKDKAGEVKETLTFSLAN